MHLTQEYIDRKAKEYGERKLSPYLADALITELQYRLEKQRIDLELSSAGHANPTTDTSATT